MFRSITAKLVLAFLLVSVTVLALASGITYLLTARSFKQLVFNQSQDRFAAEAALYYRVNGTWDGVLDYFNARNNPPKPNGPDSLDFQPNLQSFGSVSGEHHTFSFAFLLADINGKVLVPAGEYQLGDTVPGSKLSQGTSVEVDGTQVGSVLVLGTAPPLGSLEAQYYTRTNQGLLYAALGAALAALILGIFIARSLTHPLRDLTAAIQGMAKGELKQHVHVKSRDELGKLAAAFNQMSADLDRLNQSRRQMTADIAHDLRTPLTVIGGYIESMRDGVLKPTRERMDTIYAEVQHLQRLVEDLRTLSQADAGELTLNLEAVSPETFLEQMKKSYAHLAAKKEVALKVDVESGLPEVRFDPDRMAQVFGNLITNSLRHTPQNGEVALSAEKSTDGFVFSVKDNGEGISAEDLPHIFDRFYRADIARAREGESGLGLAIARSIVEAHGGTISAESELGKGTKISIAFRNPSKA